MDTAPAPQEAAPEQEAPAPEAESHGDSQPDVDFAKRFSALSRREKAIRQQQEEFKARQREFEEKQREYQQWQQLKASAKDDPLAFLEANGLTYQEITNRILDDDSLSPEEKAQKIAKAEIDEFKRQLAEEREQKAKEQQELEEKAKEEEIINRYKDGIRQVCQDTDKFSLINYEGDTAHELVFQVAEDYFAEHGEVLSPEDAATQVENFLEKRYKEALNLPKFKDLEQDSKPQESPKEESRVGTHRSLTNQDTLSYTDGSQEESYRIYMSDEESKARAAETLRKALAGR